MSDELKTMNKNNDPETLKKGFAIVHMALNYSRLELSLSSYQLFKGQEKPEWAPKIETEIQTKASPLGDDRHEVSLTMILNGKTQQGQGLFQVKLEQKGIFQMKGFTKEEEGVLLKGHALSQLYPYATARVNELLIHAGFPPINMNPVDFVGLYQQQQAKAQGKTEETAIDSVH